MFKPALSSTQSEMPPLPGQPTGVFTTERPTIRDAINDFFGRRPRPQQPIDFPHNIHVDKKIPCAFCHEGVERGPVAGIPSVNLCMICHVAIATDRPRIQQITGAARQGLDLPWQRVYGFAHESARDVQSRAAHPRQASSARPVTATSAQQTVAQRNVDLTMGFCVTCHREKKAPNDCLTCHF